MRHRVHRRRRGHPVHEGSNGRRQRSPWTDCGYGLRSASYMESDDAPQPEILAAIAEALEALNQTQPALILEIITTIHAPSRGRKNFVNVQAAARNAATAVRPQGKIGVKIGLS